MRPVGDIFIDNGVEIEVEQHDGIGCRGCYYDGRAGCGREETTEGVCGTLDEPYLYIIFKEHIRKTVKLDLTE